MKRRITTVRKKLCISVTAMDRRITALFQEESLARQRQNTRNTKYQSLLKRTIANFEVDPQTHVVIYQNDAIMDQMETELQSKMTQLEGEAKTLAQLTEKVRRRIPDSGPVQLKVEMVDQHIRILEAAVRVLPR